MYVDILRSLSIILLVVGVIGVLYLIFVKKIFQDPQDKEALTFEEFSEWCNRRACDGMWGFNDAATCSEVCIFMYSISGRRRKEYWREVREDCKAIMDRVNKQIALLDLELPNEEVREDD